MRSTGSTTAAVPPVTTPIPSARRPDPFSFSRHSNIPPWRRPRTGAGPSTNAANSNAKAEDLETYRLLLSANLRNAGVPQSSIDRTLVPIGRPPNNPNTQPAAATRSLSLFSSPFGNDRPGARSIFVGDEGQGSGVQLSANGGPFFFSSPPNIPPASQQPVSAPARLKFKVNLNKLKIKTRASERRAPRVQTSSGPRRHARRRAEANAPPEPEDSEDYDSLDSEDDHISPGSTNDMKPFPKLQVLVAGTRLPQDQSLRSRKRKHELMDEEAAVIEQMRASRRARRTEEAGLS